MRKIAVALTKGGVGKTTTAVNLAAGLAINGATVLLVDTDTQGHAGFMLGTHDGEGLTELIAGNALPQDVTREAREGLWLINGGRSLSHLRQLMDRQESGGEGVLYHALQSVEGRYDYVVLDTSPGWDAMIINVLFYADEILAPVSLDILTLKGLAEFIDRLSAIREYSPIALNYIVPTFLDGRVRKSGEVHQLLQDYYDRELCSPIRYNVKLSEASGHGQTIYEYAPRSPGADDYQKLVERVMQNGNT